MLSAATVVCCLALASASRFSNRFSSQPIFQAPPAPSSANDCITQPGQWGPCSKSCGGGIRSRRPIIVKEATGYGRQCPDLHEETENCNPQPCPIDCVVEPGTYGPCSASCGSGTQTKLDIIIQEAQYGGKACPAEFQLKSTIQCPRLPPCPVPVDCQIGYTEYGQCSQPCGGGQHSRTAFIVQPAQNGGAPCPADLNALTDTKNCNVDIPCREPKDCEFIQGEFGECSATCGYGVQKCQIYIIAEADGGRECPRDRFLTQPCNAGPCPEPMDCVVQWQPFSYCTQSCNGGTQTASGQIVKQASAGGAPCPSYGQLSVTRTCNNQACGQFIPRDCEVEYGSFSQCDKPCGGGYRYQKGFIKAEPEFGGLACPNPSQLVKRESCNNFPCAVPQDCKVERGYWSDCDKKCGGGQQTRTVTIVAYAANGGIACPTNNIDTRSCNTQPCQQAPPTYGRAPAPAFVPRAAPAFVPRAPARRAPAATSFSFGGYQ